MGSGKILPLEALRGIAALLVVANHFALSFLPYLIHLRPHSAKLEGALLGSPLFLLVNGHAMVIIFFVLSGYVLALKGMRADAGYALAETAIKRWFRFTPLICVALGISYMLFSLNLYYFTDAGKLSGSLWLELGTVQGLTQYAKPAFSSILQDGLYRSLLLGEWTYDSALWTMAIEFWGSLIVLAASLLLIPQKRLWFVVVVPLVYIFTSPLSANSILCSCFLIGPLCVMLGLRERTLTHMQALGLLGMGLYLCGYYYPQGWYGWLATLPLPEKELRTVILSFGGFLLLCVFATRNCISAQFNGPVSYFMGIISFPLYLLHVLILASFSSWIFIYENGSHIGIFFAAIVLMILALPLSWALGIFDQWWLRRLAAWHPLQKTIII